MTRKPLRLTASVRRVITAVIATAFIGAATISAQFVVFDEVFEGEIWELISTLQIPAAVDAEGATSAFVFR